MVKKMLFCATVDYHFKAFHLPYLKWIKEQGWQVDVAAAGQLELPYTDNQYDISIERSPFSKNNLKAYKQLKEIINETHYDIIHCHTPLGGVLTRLAAKEARKNGTKVIYTAHGFHFCKDTPIINWLLYYPIEKYLSRHTDSLITINQEDFSLATRRNFGAKEIKLIHGVGVNTDEFRPANNEMKTSLKKKYGYQPSDFLLFNAGEFNKNKNQKHLIRSLALIKNDLPNAKLLLAGEGVLLEECRELANELDVSHMVVFLGFRRDIKQLLQVSDVAVTSSFREGLPVNVMEAMSSGLPVISVENRGIRDLIKHQISGLMISTWDPVDFADQIKELAKDPLLRSRLGSQARDLIDEQFSTQKILSIKSEVYQELMDGQELMEEQGERQWAIG